MKAAEILALKLQERIRSCINEDVDDTDEQDDIDNLDQDDDQNKDDEDKNDENIDSDEKIEIECMAVGRERVEEARELGVTPGKLNLVQKLMDSSENPEEIDVEEWLNKPVKEINKAIKENRKAAKEEMKAETKELQNGDGHNNNTKQDYLKEFDRDTFEENDLNTKHYSDNECNGDKDRIRDKEKDWKDNRDNDKNNEFKGNAKDNSANNGQGNNKNKEKGNANGNSN